MIPEEQDQDSGERTMFVTREHLLNALSAADTLAHYLVVLEGTSPGKRLEIGAEPITIGRGLQQTLAIAARISPGLAAGFRGLIFHFVFLVAMLLEKRRMPPYR